MTIVDINHCAQLEFEKVEGNHSLKSASRHVEASFNAINDESEFIENVNLKLDEQIDADN
jgi:hypothetical protein